MNVSLWHGKQRGAQTMNIEQHLLERVTFYTKRVNEVFPSLRFRAPTVAFYHKRKAAGLANCKAHRVSFNTILAQENLEKFDETVIHELAHLVTGLLYPGKRGHCDEFHLVNGKLGGRASRCNSYSLENVPYRRRKVARQFEYVCSCEGKIFKLTAVRHNRIVKKGMKYHCLTCKSTLTPRTK
jgi:predicted SprT family Zn-dependent metalloprotease